MDQDIKNEWVADLRSGRYEQGQHHLKSDGKYCCLGVLCEQYCRANSLNIEEFIEDYAQDADEFLPGDVRRWSELESADPTIYGKTLSDYNDSGMSFSEMADLIELNL